VSFCTNVITPESIFVETSLYHCNNPILLIVVSEIFRELTRSFSDSFTHNQKIPAAHVIPTLLLTIEVVSSSTLMNILLRDMSLTPKFKLYFVSGIVILVPDNILNFL